jgi:hypothetical protein
MLDHSDPVTKMTRDSCLECCEKHLGAALVLMAEHRDGYPHRLRAIGHLHEAEDETQAWPELHDALREARKAYQVDGAAPDVEHLMGLIASVRAETRDYASSL